MKAPLPVIQEWTWSLPLMQQTVLLSAIRACDGMPKRHKHKPLMRWYRRCVVISAFERKALVEPLSPAGGDFTGPVVPTSRHIRESDGRFSYTTRDGKYVTVDGQRQLWDAILKDAVDDFLDSRDELSQHYYEHAMHAFEVLGYKHPVPWIRKFWHYVYTRIVMAKHLWPEMEGEMDKRLGDDEANWRERGDPSASCSV